MAMMYVSMAGMGIAIEKLGEINWRLVV